MLASKTSDSKKKTSFIIMGINLLIIISAVCYYYYGKSDGDVAVDIQANSISSQAVISKINIQQIDTSVFSNDSFLKLDDKIKMGVKPNPQKGNASPFEPK